MTRWLKINVALPTFQHPIESGGSEMASTAFEELSAEALETVGGGYVSAGGYDVT